MATTTQESPAAVTALNPPRRNAAPAAHVVDADIGALVQSQRDNQVTFNDVARAWFHVCDEDLPDAQRARCEELFPQLLSAFGRPRGGVFTAYFCRHVRIVAALTDIHRAAELGESLPQASELSDDDANVRVAWWRRGLEARRELNAASSSALHIEWADGDPVDAKARVILFQCLDLHYRAIEFLNPKPRKICMRMIMGVVSSLLATLDERQATSQRAVLDRQEVECLEHVLEQARGYYDRSAQRQAQIEYFIGMAAGLALLFGGLLTVVLLSGADVGSDPLLYTPLAAGLGAFVSVLSRMTRGQLQLSYESGRTIMHLLGLIRPLLGGLFGPAVYVLLAGGLLSIHQPTAGHEVLYYLGIAFVAGFSERFAQDMLARAPGATAAPAAAPAAGATVAPASRAPMPGR
ncbi:MAG: hypothetical protein QOD24_4121 [Solirubrobacteraceae bacterium]|nr:hypothetical protein [Solirubrobacteraceae bacterium]